MLAPLDLIDKKLYGIALPTGSLISEMFHAKHAVSTAQLPQVWQIGPSWKIRQPYVALSLSLSSNTEQTIQ